MPIDGLYHNATILGVPLSIDAVDPNGNTIHLATVTSDVSGTFSYTWTPNNAGDYKITATFAGSDSYGSSWAETHANVVNTPEMSSTPTQAQAAPDYTMTIVAGVIAIIIAVLIMGVALVLILRKR